jgi:hypothetical protein
LPRHWIGRTFANDHLLLHWPLRSPDLMPCNFFLWGYIKDSVFVLSLPRDQPELQR